MAAKNFPLSLPPSPFFHTTQPTDLISISRVDTLFDRICPNNPLLRRPSSPLLPNREIRRLAPFASKKGEDGRRGEGREGGRKRTGGTRFSWVASWKLGSAIFSVEILPSQKSHPLPPLRSFFKNLFYMWWADLRQLRKKIPASASGSDQKRA